MTDPITRRNALALITAGLTGLWALATGAITAVFVATPLRNRGRSNTVNLGNQYNFTSDYALVKLDIPRDDGWYVKSEQLKLYVRTLDSGETQVLSARCSHLGCSVNWDTDAAEFVCPCHEGRYDAKGKVIDGPPPAPLTQLPVDIRDEEVFIKIT